MKKIIITITFLIVTLISFSQVKSTLSVTRVVKESGIFKSPPPSKTINIKVDVEKALKETKEEESLGLDLPYRFGKGVEVNYTLENSGDWFETEGGRVWKLKIKSEKAYSLSLIFSKLIISSQTKIYIYNEEGSMIYGPITSESIAKNGSFSSDIIKGDGLILELFEPSEEKGNSVLNLSRIVHGFRNIFQPTNFGDSNLYCQDDVSCNSNWAIQSNGVAMIILSNMERICSGSLLNNACQDFTPNILTAFHCIDIGNDINNINACSNNEVGNGTLTAQEIANAENWVFRFQYKRSNCNTGSEPYSFYTFQRATFRAGWFNSDFALVEMNQNPVNGDPDSGIRYLGWTRSGVAPTSGAILGHPKGDVMKISTFGTAASNTSQIVFNLCTYPLRQSISPVNTHWTTSINDGALEGGSSGGPFFDQNNRVIGQLHGGVIGCAPTTAHAGRFDISWTGGGNANNQLSTWLTNDPNVIQTNTISIPTISGSSSVCSFGTTYSINYLPSGATVSWTCTSTNSNLTIDANSGYAYATNSTSSQETISAIIHTGCGNVTLPAKTVWVGIPHDVELYCESGTAAVVGYNNSLWVNSFNYDYDSIVWGAYPAPRELIDLGGGYANIIFDSPGTYTMWANNVNDCGYSTTAYIQNFYVYELLMSPNPASNEVEITISTGEAEGAKSASLSSDDAYTVTVLDIYGTVKIQRKYSGNKFTIPVSSLKDGNYIVKVNNKKINSTKQLIIKH